MTIASLRSDRNFPCALWLPTGYPFESGRPVAAAFSRQGWWTAGTMATRPGRGGTADRRPVGVGLTTRLRGRGRPPVGEPASREPLALRDLAQRARERRPNRDRRRWSPAKAGGACVMRVAMPRDCLLVPADPFKRSGGLVKVGTGVPRLVAVRENRYRFTPTGAMGARGCFVPRLRVSGPRGIARHSSLAVYSHL